MLCLEAVLSLKINLGESEAVPIAEVNDINSLANVCCKERCLPMNYLSMQLDSSFKARGPMFL